MNDKKRVDDIEKVLAEKGIYVGKTSGISMEPMLREGRDTVIVKKAELPLKKYDIPVYKRNGRYVMHRIVRVTRSGYVICGDNCVGVERDITDDKIVGVLAGFYQGDKYIESDDREYMRYAKQALKRYRKMRLMHLLRRVLKGLPKSIKAKLKIILNIK